MYNFQLPCFYATLLTSSGERILMSNKAGKGSKILIVMVLNLLFVNVFQNVLEEEGVA